MKYTASTVMALAGSLIAASAIADDYDYELGLSIGRLNSDMARPELFTETITLPASSQSSVSEQINLAGAWYYSGLSAATGPKSQAAFLGRAV